MRILNSVLPCAAILLAGAIAWSLCGEPSPQSDGGSVASVDRQEAAAAPLAGEIAERLALHHGYAAEPGDTFTFAVRMDQRTEMSSPADPSAIPVSLQLALRATLLVTVIAVTTDGFVVSVGATDVTTEPPGLFPHPVSTPITVSYGRDGTVGGYAWDQHTTMEAANLLATLFTRTHQFPYRRLASWPATLRDETGLCAMQLGWLDASAGETLVRTKLGLTVPTGDVVDTVKITQSHDQARLVDGWIVDSECDECIELRGSWQASTISLRLRATLLARERQPVSGEVPDLRFAAWPPRVVQPEAQRDLASILVEMRELLAQGSIESAAAMQLYLELVRLLQSDAGAARALADAIVNGDLHPPLVTSIVTGVLISALAHAAAEGGQGCVAGLLRILDLPDDETAGYVLRSVHHIADLPWSDLEGLLAGICDRCGAPTASAELRGEGWLGVGSLLQGAPAGELRDRALAGLRDGVDPATFVSALANSRNPELILAHALPMLAGGDDAVRLRVVEALACCHDSPAAASALLATLRSDPDDVVRAAAVRSLAGFGDGVATTEAVWSALHDPVVDVRLAALDVLGTRPVSSGRSRALRQAATDADERVRTLAAELLARG